MGNCEYGLTHKNNQRNGLETGAKALMTTACAVKGSYALIYLELSNFSLDISQDFVFIYCK